MCRSGAPPLCCGKSNRQRCVPFTSLIHASGPEAAAPGVCASARLLANNATPAAVPNNRAIKFRRCASFTFVIRAPPEAEGSSCGEPNTCGVDDGHGDHHHGAADTENRQLL